MRPILLALVLALTVGAAAQTPPAAPPLPPGKAETAPVLSEVDRLRIINALQAVELATAKVQLAANDLAKVRTDADSLIKSLQQPGWVLNDQLLYVRPAKDGGGQ